MEDKTQYEALVEELQKIVENFRDGLIEIGERLSKVLPDIEIPDEEEDTWEMKCPYEHNDMYYLISNRGTVDKCWFNSDIVDEPRWLQGNTFKTREAAELEAKRRNLLTRFRAFRDECNNGWKPDWSNNGEKWEIDYKEEEGLIAVWTSLVNSFSTFGYFKNKQDAQRAIDLFGDEIKALYVDCEV